MINYAVMWYLLVPLALSILTVFIMRRYAKGVSLSQIIGASAIGLVIAALIITTCFFGGRASKTHDTQVLNGAVTGKTREHGFYLRPYDCNCRQVESCSGSGSNRSCSSHQECDTCYEDRFTVDWDCQTTIGSFDIEHYDEGSRSVYNEPDPPRYSQIKIDDPVSRTQSYTNYIKAVPETLFRPAQKELLVQYAAQIPAYPDDIYDIYKIDRVIGIGVSIPDVAKWNLKVSEALRTLGNAKQANIVIVITSIKDPNYFYALQDAWVNGKKNDIVVVMSAPDFPAKARWVNIMALTKDNIFQVKLRDRLLALDVLTADTVVNEIAAETSATFARREMMEFKYLEAEIDPPFWVMMTCMILIFIAYFAFWVFTFQTRDSSSFGRYGTPNWEAYSRRNPGMDFAFRRRSKF